MTIKTRLERAEERAGKDAPRIVIAWCRNGTAYDELPDGYAAHIDGDHVNRRSDETAADYLRRLKVLSRGGPVVFLDEDSQKL